MNEDIENSDSPAMENSSIKKRLTIILVVVFIFISLVTFGLFQTAKGARFHLLNVLHLKYVLELNDLLQQSDNNELDVEKTRAAIMNIKMQPMACLELINPLDTVMMRLFGTDKAITLCENDIALADTILQALQRYQQGTISAVEIYEQLLTAGRQFTLHSAQFEQPTSDNLQYTTLTSIIITLTLGLLVVSVVITLSRGISTTVLKMEKTAGELARSQERNRQLARFDDLTGLPNRNQFMERLDYAIDRAERQRSRFVLLFIDLDRFKAVNDSLGHIAGDMLLNMAGQRLRNSVREGDVVARLSGDEFTIIFIDQLPAGNVAKFAQRILLALAEPFNIEGADIYVSGSIGITTFPNDATTATTLIKNADMAMYQAKAQGKNNFEFYSVKLDAEASSRSRCERDLRESLHRDEMHLVFQPIVRLSDMQTVGAETLIRWEHSERGIVSPAEFIPIAEEIGLIVDIGEWVIHAACEQLKAWHSAGHDHFRIALNVSVRQLNSEQFARTVREAIELAGIPPDKLGLEITESLFLDDAEKCIRTLHELAEIGVKLLLDDFGTGYSSFSYLHTLPFNILKIDRSFVQNIGYVKEMEEIAASIISMAHTLKMQVTAEGIETLEALDYLVTRNCEFAQGFLFDKPMKAELFDCAKTYKQITTKLPCFSQSRPPDNALIDPLNRKC